MDLIKYITLKKISDIAAVGRDVRPLFRSHTKNELRALGYHIPSN